MAEAARGFTESRVGEELGLDRLEVYLAAVCYRLGRYDSVTHLLVFSDAEVDALARHLDLPRQARPAPAPVPRPIPESTGE